MNQRNHHYIPRCYLKRFCKQTDKPFISIYNNQDNSYNENNIKNILSEHGFYAIPKEWSKNNDTESLEKFFADIENRVSSVLNTINHKKSIVSLDLDNWTTLHFFMACQIVRNNTMFSMQKELINKVHKRLEDLGIADNNELSHQGHQNLFVRFIIESLRDGTVYEKCNLLNCRIYELVKTEQCFITSDNPINFTWMDNTPEEICQNPLYVPCLGIYHTTLIYSLSSKFCLIGYLDPDLINKQNIPETRELNKEETDQINNIISQNSYQYIFAKDKHTLDSVIKKTFKKEQLESLL